MGCSHQGVALVVRSASRRPVRRDRLGARVGTPTPADREEITLGLHAEKSFTVIAARLDKAVSTYRNGSPVSGIEPLTCRLQEVRPRALYALAAPMAHVIALTALAALGLSRASFHELFHADGRQWPMTVTERSDQNPP